MYVAPFEVFQRLTLTNVKFFFNEATSIRFLTQQSFSLNFVFVKSQKCKTLNIFWGCTPHTQSLGFQLFSKPLLLRPFKIKKVQERSLFDTQNTLLFV